MSSDTEADEDFEWQESVGEPDDGTGDGTGETAAASASTGTPASTPASTETPASAPAATAAEADSGRELVSDHPIKGEILREVLEYFEETDIDESFAEIGRAHV